jgi:riboflavin synthase alpha subunit
MHDGHGVAGKVTAVNGTTLTVTKDDGTSYTVDASATKVSKVVDLTVGDIKVGDTVGVMGTLTGTSVKALHIMDGIPPRPQAPPAAQ